LDINPKQVFSVAFFGPVLELILPDAKVEDVSSRLAIGGVKVTVLDPIAAARTRLRTRTPLTREPTLEAVIAQAINDRDYVVRTTRGPPQQVAAHMRKVLAAAILEARKSHGESTGDFIPARPRGRRGWRRAQPAAADEVVTQGLDGEQQRRDNRAREQSADELAREGFVPGTSSEEEDGGDDIPTSMEVEGRGSTANRKRPAPEESEEAEEEQVVSEVRPPVSQ
jgi:hypothetical protein